jgi:tetratricopeptide (TPR) repeat protein
LRAPRPNHACFVRVALWLGVLLAILIVSPGCRSIGQVASGEVHLAKAALYLRSGRPLFARAEYARADSEQPDNASLLRGFASLFSRYGRWGDCVRAYEDSLAAKPDANTAVLLAGIYWSAPGFGIQRSGQAIESTLKLALSCDPNHPEALNSLAYFYAERGERLTEALQMSRKSIRLSPTTPAYLDTLGWICYQMGRPAEALPYLEQAVALEWQSAELRDHLARCLEKLGHKDRALIERTKARLLSGQAAPSQPTAPMPPPSRPKERRA